MTIDMATKFTDPDNDTLTYAAASSDTARLGIERNGSMVTLTPGSPGRAQVTLYATDPGGLTTARGFTVTVTAGTRDYDADNDGLIDVRTLAQLDALRYDLNGDGLVDGATWMPYYAAFTMGALGMGCPRRVHGLRAGGGPGLRHRRGWGGRLRRRLLEHRRRLAADRKRGHSVRGNLQWQRPYGREPVHQSADRG